MPRSGPNGTYTLPGAQATQVAGTPIPSAVNNQGYSDIEQTFNTVQPVPYGGTGVADGKPLDNTFGVKNSTDLTKIGVFNAANIPAGQTRTYDLPYYSGTLGLVSDIRGQIYGLTLSNNVTDAVNDIDIAAGAAVDTTGTASMLLASALGKRVDATWVAGGTPASANGGRFYTTLANGWIYLFVIRNPTTGVVDVGFSDNATNPTGGASYPAGFTQYVYIGAIARVAGVIAPFVQDKDHFWLLTSVQDVNVTNLGTSNTEYVLSVPPVAGTRAIIQGQASNAAGWAMELHATGLAAPAVFSRGAGGQANGFGQLEIRTNASSQITAKSSATNTNLNVYTVGWVDGRLPG